ncbi:glycosyltransferase family 4 protein [uncultured Shewanella sp.]|uniref:glycosyltransferase family 4 protein n=1 Tax=uncultured Shewanella sp. TaxID=173975 RepID=UPI0026179A9B|nr:glycosyltransferase family 4 protein [uncultured Shewanella sp.]
MIMKKITIRKKTIGYKKVKRKVLLWSIIRLDAEKLGLKKVNNNYWHAKDLYQALISINREKPKLVDKYGKKYLLYGGNATDTIDIIKKHGIKFSVSGFFKHLKKYGINNTLDVYSIELLSKEYNGVNISKSIYTEIVKRNVSLALPYGIFSAIKLNNEKLKKHVTKRLERISNQFDVTEIFVDSFKYIDNKEVINNFIEPIILYGDDKFIEKTIRINLEELNIELTSNLLISKGVTNETYNITRKIAAIFWANNNFKHTYKLYAKLLPIKYETILAERYVITAIETNNEPDAQLPFIHEIKTGYDNIMKSPLSFFNKSWAEKYPNMTKKAIDYYALKGDLIAAVTLCHQLNVEHPKVAHWQAWIDIANNGLTLPSPDKIKKAYNQNIAYLLYNSLPVHSGGYASRSHGIISNLMSLGINPYVITRLGYPYDLKQFKNKQPLNEEYYKGIVYHRSLDGPGLNYVPINEYLTHYKNAIKQKLIENQTSIIHAASNHINGITAVLAGRELGINSIYEVRGLWEITRISREPEWANTLEFEAYQYLETLACKEADTVITITQALKNELIKRDIPAEKIHVIPNGVDTNTFMPLPLNTHLKSELNIPIDNVVIGYVGSIVDYEGLDLLVESIQIMIKNNITGFTVLIIGDGAALLELKQQVTDAQLNDYFIFTGRVAHNKVPDYYSIIDICPFPRRGVPVCELVSPLKPFEAMAMGKVIIGSSVQAIAEFIFEGENGLVHEKDDAVDLADKLTMSICDKALRETLKATSRKWVIENRDWAVLASKVNRIYLNSNTQSQVSPEPLISCA